MGPTEVELCLTLSVMLSIVRFLSSGILTLDCEAGQYHDVHPLHGLRAPGRTGSILAVWLVKCSSSWWFKMKSVEWDRMQSSTALTKMCEISMEEVRVRTGGGFDQYQI